MHFCIVPIAKYHTAQNFGGIKLWQIAANKDFGGQNIGELAALYCEIAWIKIIDA